MPHRYVLTDQYWKMRIAHPYSMLACCDDLAVTCGQAAIGESGEVLFPGDLLSQTDRVIQTADKILRDAGMTRDDLERIVIFTSEVDRRRREQCLDRFRRQAPDTSTVYLVTLPPLFYPDLLVEVDYYGIPGRVSVQAIRTFAIEVDVGPGLSKFPSRVSRAIQVTLDQRLQTLGLDRSNVIKLSCYAPCRKISFWEALSRERLSWFAAIPAISDVVTESASGPGQIILDFTCIGGFPDPGIKPVGTTLERGHPEAVLCGSMLFTSSLFTSSLFRDTGTSTQSPGNTEEVDSIMERHRELLGSEGMDFEDVIKATTFYQGAGSPQALHENMAARNAYYQVPGPGSTGLPVSAFPYGGKRTSIELIAAVQS